MYKRIEITHVLGEGIYFNWPQAGKWNGIFWKKVNIIVYLAAWPTFQPKFPARLLQCCLWHSQLLRSIDYTQMEIGWQIWHLQMVRSHSLQMIQKHWSNNHKNEEKSHGLHILTPWAAELEKISNNHPLENSRKYRKQIALWSSQGMHILIQAITATAWKTNTKTGENLDTWQKFSGHAHSHPLLHQIFTTSKTIAKTSWYEDMHD